MKTNRQSWLFDTRIAVCLVHVLGMSSARADNGTFDTYFTTLPKEESKGMVTTLYYREEGGSEIYLAFANALGSAYGKTTWIIFSNPWGAEGKLWLECADAANSLYVLAAQGPNHTSSLALPSLNRNFALIWQYRTRILQRAPHPCTQQCQRVSARNG